MSNKNFGYLFGKNYYKGFDYDYKNKSNEKEYLAPFFDKKHKPFLDELANIPKPNEIDNSCQFDLITRYPGLTLGTGYGHGLSEVVGDFKIGLSFDHTTGLPIIPGSSLKGALRAVFPNAKGKNQHKNTSDKVKGAKRAYIKALLDKNQECDIDELELEIFEGISPNGLLPMSLRDTFWDAEIVKSNDSGKIFGDDYITPHPNPLKNPKPIRFLKILPNVVFRFSFELQDGIINKKDKLDLFKQILKDQGIGAKTNVGYGRLS